MFRQSGFCEQKRAWGEAQRTICNNSQTGHSPGGASLSPKPYSLTPLGPKPQTTNPLANCGAPDGAPATGPLAATRGAGASISSSSRQGSGFEVEGFRVLRFGDL